MSGRTALALSPHLDDAAFSAGATLHALARAGWRTVVATVFTRSVPNPQGFALACQLDKGLAPDLDYMALRRDEDADACARLRAEPRWLPFAEAPHRGYGSAPALFAGLRADDTAAEAVTPALRALAAELRPDLVLAPQAVGGHVDHVALVHAIDRAGLDAPVLWWRDYPYAVRQESPAEPLAARFSGLPERRVAATEDDRAARLAAALAYRSQLGFQFGGPEAARARLAGENGETFRVEGTPPAALDALQGAS